MLQPDLKKKKSAPVGAHIFFNVKVSPLHNIKAGENQASLVPLLAKLLVRVPLSPLELLIISFQF